MVLSLILKLVKDLIIAKIKMINAGHAANAEAKNRGHKRAVFQKGLDCKP